MVLRSDCLPPGCFEHCVPGSNNGDTEVEYTVHSGLSMVVWESEMTEYPDREFLLDGLRNGFHITEPSAVIDQYEVQNQAFLCGCI